MSEALVVLTVALRHLHRRAGEPSTRAIGKKINYSHTTVAKVLNGSRCRSWPVLEAIVLHLKGDVEEFRKLWLAVRQAEDPLPQLPSTVTVNPLAAGEMSVLDMGSDSEGQRISQTDDRVELSWDFGRQPYRFSGPSGVAWDWYQKLKELGEGSDE